MHGHSATKTDAGTLTGGDWGEGRVALSPVGKLKEGPCGNTNARNAFFLHGGILAGSSGCIDIGGDFSKLADWLAEYRGSVRLTVKYENTAPSVRGWTGFTGAVAYQRFGFGLHANVGLGAELQGESERFLV